MSGDRREAGPEEAPVLPAYETEDGRQWVVWCEWCGTWHWHAPSEGHRVEHCAVPGGPYAPTGYVLRPAGRLTPDLRRRVEREGRRCVECGGPDVRGRGRCLRCRGRLHAACRRSHACGA